MERVPEALNTSKATANQPEDRSQLPAASPPASPAREIHLAIFEDRYNRSTDHAPGYCHKLCPWSVKFLLWDHVFKGAFCYTRCLLCLLSNSISTNAGQQVTRIREL